MILDAIEEVKFDKVKELAKNIKTNINENAKINEDDVESLKKQIIDILKDDISYDTLERIVTILKKADIEEIVDDLIKKKNLLGFSGDILNKFMIAKGSYTQKIEILRYIRDNDAINVKTLKESKQPIKVSDILTFPKTISIDLATRLFFRLYNVTGGNGANAVGGGEISLIMYIKDAIKPNVGDVQIGNEFLEVKGIGKSNSNGGKLIGTKDVDDPYNVYVNFIKPFFESNNIPLPDDLNKLNFTTKEARLITYLQENSNLGTKDIIKFVEKVLSKIHRGKKVDLSSFYKNIDTGKIIKKIAELQIRIYLEKLNENGKTSLVFINAPKGTMFLIDLDNIDERIGYVKVGNTISFAKGAQSPTYRFGI